MTIHCVIPDCQIRPGVSTDHLEWIGNYLVKHKPDVIVCLGDFADMPSLSLYDIGKRSAEGKRYTDDIKSAHDAMERLFNPIREEQKRLIQNKKKQWNPRLVMCLGNHEERINRATNDNPKLHGTISIEDLKYKEYGWEVYPYLEVVKIDGILYSHYFTTGVMGKPVTSASMLTKKKFMSCIQGHVQKTEIDMSSFAGDGRPIISIMAGCCYLHNEDYLGPQGNTVHRQFWMLYEVNDGFFYPHPIGLNYMRDWYEKKKQTLNI